MALLVVAMAVMAEWVAVVAVAVCSHSAMEVPVCQVLFLIRKSTDRIAKFCPFQTEKKRIINSQAAGESASNAIAEAPASACLT